MLQQRKRQLEAWNRMLNSAYFYRVPEGILIPPTKNTISPMLLFWFNICSQIWILLEWFILKIIQLIISCQIFSTLFSCLVWNRSITPTVLFRKKIFSKFHGNNGSNSCMQVLFYHYAEKITSFSCNFGGKNTRFYQTSASLRYVQCNTRTTFPF